MSDEKTLGKEEETCCDEKEVCCSEDQCSIPQEAYSKALREICDSFLKLRCILDYTKEANKEKLETEEEPLREKLGKAKKLYKNRIDYFEEKTKRKEKIEDKEKVELTELKNKVDELDIAIQGVVEAKKAVELAEKSVEEYLFYYKHLSLNREAFLSQLK